MTTAPWAWNFEYQPITVKEYAARAAGKLREQIDQHRRSTDMRYTLANAFDAFEKDEAGAGAVDWRGLRRGDSRAAPRGFATASCRLIHVACRVRAAGAAGRRAGLHNAAGIRPAHVQQTRSSKHGA
jgi:hypothetical protein